MPIHPDEYEDMPQAGDVQEVQLESRDVLEPVQQDIVLFYGKQIVAVRLSDGRIAATLNSLCEALGLAIHSQGRRIHDDDVLDEQLVPVRISTSGGPQVMGVLTAWAIPLWLTGIQTKRLAAEKRPAITAFKRQAANVLYNHFSQIPTALPSSTMLVPSVPIERPQAPEEGASLAIWREYHQAMLSYIDWQEEVEQWRGHVEHRLEQVEEVTRLVPEILERLGPQTLTPEHQATVKNAVRHLSELTGNHFQTIYADLNESFHVAKYDQIPEARWLEVSAWLKTRIDADEKRRKH